ncbi:hypothetical protein PDE_08027 [Penicillium oxalicum 114-2]|uniref:Terpene synthase n=1 Tax=Penicillium oxalicum (strain 114-2 / CGMCC 5302) TaxID=933388 RepID=S7ZQQ8_PENO1|nr:hypothetical protein PDE_08027 [Penicillium oxalicum 114-2]
MAARWFYPSHDREIQIDIAVFTALMFSIDDLGNQMPGALRTYRSKIMLGLPQDSQQIADFLKIPFQMESWLDNFALDMVFKSQLEFLSANLVENEYGDRLCPHPSTPQSLRSYFRLKSGICEPYAFFIWPSSIMVQDHNHNGAPLAIMPDLMTWINDTNDIMSFYKESIIGDEVNNSISLHARAKSQTLLESVKDHVSLATDAFVRIMEFAKDQHPEVQRKLLEFLNGYIAIHYKDPRYHMQDLSISHSLFDQ